MVTPDSRTIRALHEIYRFVQDLESLGPTLDPCSPYIALYSFPTVAPPQINSLYILDLYFNHNLDPLYAGCRYVYYILCTSVICIDYHETSMLR